MYDDKIKIKKNNSREILIKLNLNLILFKKQKIIPKVVKTIIFKFTIKLPAIKEIGNV